MEKFCCTLMHNSKMKLASISFDRQVYVIQNETLEFVFALAFIALMKAGIGALFGIEKMKADALGGTGEFAKFACEIGPKTNPREHIVRVNGSGVN